jgi:hypothetical protein
MQPLQTDYQEVVIGSEQEDESDPTPVASKKVPDYALQSLNPPPNVYIL